MGDDFTPGVDLFGDPLLPLKETRGRKAHRRCREVAEKVAILSATGSKVAQIARRVGLSDKTLTKYYSRELEHGGTLARQLLVEAQFAKALDGNTAAFKAIKDELARGDTEAFSAAQRSERTPRLRAERPLGKKDQQRLDAGSAGEDSDWGEDLKAPSTH